MKEPEQKAPTRVWVQYSRKVNIGNFESVDFGAGLSMDVEHGGTVAAAFEEAWSIAKHQVDRKVKALHKRLQKEVDQ